MADDSVRLVISTGDCQTGVYRVYSRCLRRLLQEVVISN